MTSKSNNQGRAYEYAWALSLKNALSKIRQVKLISNSSLDANAKAWQAVSPKMQQLLKISAEAAVDTILELEPLAVEVDADTLTLIFQKDDKGKTGDVRDLLLCRDEIEWQVGLSIKHNHEAVKHSRLSKQLDFGKEWFGIPCSADYWKEVGPIFAELEYFKQRNIKWSELSDKQSSIYVPLLNAFINEIKRSYKKDPTLPRKIIEYLIGKCDYYKVISHDADCLTVVKTFNLHNTLNKPSKVKISAFTIPSTNFPTDLVIIRLKPDSQTTVEMYLNEGWQLSFRIHSASTFVQTSLKFDIQLIGVPDSVQVICCKWFKK